MLSLYGPSLTSAHDYWKNHRFDYIDLCQLEKEMATHSSILAWRIPWTEELGELESMGHKESDMTE